MKALKNLGQFIFGIAIFALFGLLIGGMIFGMLWISSKLLPIAQVLGAIGVLLFIPLLVLSVFRSLRGFTGNSLMVVTYIWGAALWMWSTLVLFELWGAIGLILGFVLLGVGSIPLACLAMLFTGRFADFGETLLAVAVVIGVRILGAWLTTMKTQRAEHAYEASA